MAPTPQSRAVTYTFTNSYGAQASGHCACHRWARKDLSQARALWATLAKLTGQSSGDGLALCALRDQSTRQPRLFRGCISRVETPETGPGSVGDGPAVPNSRDAPSSFAPRPLRSPALVT